MTRVASGAARSGVRRACRAVTVAGVLGQGEPEALADHGGLAAAGGVRRRPGALARPPRVRGRSAGATSTAPAAAARAGPPRRRSRPSRHVEVEASVVPGEQAARRSRCRGSSAARRRRSRCSAGRSTELQSTRARLSHGALARIMRAGVDAGVGADHDVLAARAERVARAHGHGVVARVAHDLQAAHHAGAVQVPVVQPVLADEVLVEPAEVGVGDELSGEEARPAQALQGVAGRRSRAAAAAAGRRGRDQER